MPSTENTGLRTTQLQEAAQGLSPRVAELVWIASEQLVLGFFFLVLYVTGEEE